MRRQRDEKALACSSCPCPVPARASVESRHPTCLSCFVKVRSSTLLRFNFGQLLPCAWHCDELRDIAPNDERMPRAHRMHGRS